MGVTAFHVRTGERSADHAIGAWLEHHGYSVTRCADPFDAVTQLILRPDLTPELAFVGTTWLETDDFALFGYIRTTWPGAAIIAYGDDRAAIVSRNLPRVLVCRARDELADLLELDPAHVMARFANVPKPDPPQPAPPPAPELKLQPLAPKRVNGDAPPSVQSHGLPDVERHDETGILTREELAALLDDDSDD